MAKSFFVYPITRPYPYAWFTSVTIVGAIALTILFSLVSYGTYGYGLGIIHTIDPNQTFPDTKWLKFWPGEKISARCEPQDIPIGSQFFTNQLSLLYTLVDIWQPAATGSFKKSLPSLTYMNNTLEDCEISFVQIELVAEDRSAEQFGWCQWGPTISAMAVCSVANANPPVKINLTTQYDLLPQTIGNGQQKHLLSLDPLNKASLWWGASLLSAYWILLSDKMQKNRDAGSDIRKGSINLQPSLDTDITSQDFFAGNYHFNSETYPKAQVYIRANSSFSLGQYIASDEQPNIWSEVDIYGKAFYSTILADLGNASSVSSSPPPNLLTEAYQSLLQQYTEIFPTIRGCNAKREPKPSSFNDESLNANIGRLSIGRSTIMQHYLCQVPRRKSTGVLIVAILSADLVFLQAVWKLFNLATIWWLERKDQTSMYCIGSIEGDR